MKLLDHLDAFITEETRLFGEILLSRSPVSNHFLATHRKDGDCHHDMLERLTTVQEVRDLAKFDEHGEYRPLKTAPSLKSGWLIEESDIESFYLKIDAIYPAGFAGTVKYLEKAVDPVPLRRTLDRQTGMYQFAKNITDTQANQIMRDTCAKGCLRKIAWPLDEQCAVSHLPEPGRKIPIICLEACTFAVSEARRLAREAYDKANALS